MSVPKLTHIILELGDIFFNNAEFLVERINDLEPFGHELLPSLNFLLGSLFLSLKSDPQTCDASL